MTHVQPCLSDSDTATLRSAIDDDTARSASSGSRAGGVEVHSAHSSADTLGHRLRTARETRGEDLDTCARALHLPARVLRQLEADTYDGTDSKIYLGSYINSYAHHLGVQTTEIQGELDRIGQIEAPLVSSGGISRSRFLFERYTKAATYVVLTAVFVVPVIWLGMRGSLDRDPSRVTSLDAAPVSTQAVQPAPANDDGAAAPATVPASHVAVAPVQQSLMASMAPFPGLDDSPAPAPAPAATSGEGDHSVHLSLSATSWVEVIGKDGTRIEYGLLPAGSDKTYLSDQPLDVRIGNADSAQLSIDGKLVDLGNFQRANVARIHILIQDGEANVSSL